MRLTRQQQLRQSRRFPKPPDPPEGMLWVQGSLWTVEKWKAYFVEKMRGFDELPRRDRMMIKLGPTGYYEPPPVLRGKR